MVAAVSTIDPGKETFQKKPPAHQKVGQFRPTRTHSMDENQLVVMIDEGQSSNTSKPRVRNLFYLLSSCNLLLKSAVVYSV